jgi:hypothetical protein
LFAGACRLLLLNKHRKKPEVFVFIQLSRVPSTLGLGLAESLLMSDADGSVLHGGVIGSVDGQTTSNASLQETSTLTSDAYQGILRKSDTDFTISVPGLSIPFTRTWTSSRSEAGTADRVVNVTNLSDFGTTAGDRHHHSKYRSYGHV